MQDQRLSAHTIAIIRSRVEEKEKRVRARLARAAAERAENNPIDLAQRGIRARVMAALALSTRYRERWLAVADQCSKRLARAVAPLSGFTVYPAAESYIEPESKSKRVTLEPCYPPNSKT